VAAAVDVVVRMACVLKYSHSFLFIFLFINMNRVSQCDQTRS